MHTVVDTGGLKQTFIENEEGKNSSLNLHDQKLYVIVINRKLIKI